VAGNPETPFEILLMTESKARRICYSCGRSYPEVVRFCPRDGADLEYSPPPIDDLGQTFRPPRKWVGGSILLAGALAILVSVLMVSGRFTSSLGKAAESGELIVRTTPSGATIYLDGSQMGATPIRMANIRPGVHEVRAIFPGYKNGTARIEILPSVKLRVVWDLVPLRELPKDRYLAESSRPSIGIAAWRLLYVEMREIRPV
jgi:hypothetical protein